MLSLPRLERKQKIIRIHFLDIRIFLFLSLLIWNWNNKYVHTPRRSLKNHTRFQTKIDKVYTRFQTKTPQKPYPMGRHIPIWLIEGSNMWYFQRNCFIFKVKILKTVRFSESLLILFEIRFVRNNRGQKHSLSIDVRCPISGQLIFSLLYRIDELAVYSIRIRINFISITIIEA